MRLFLLPALCSLTHTQTRNVHLNSVCLAHDSINARHCGASLSEYTSGTWNSYMHMTVIRMWLNLPWEQPMGTAMLLSLSPLNVFETTLQGSHSNQTTISLIPGLEWNGAKKGESLAHFTHEKCKRSPQRNEGVCRGRLQRNAKRAYRECRGSLQRNAKEVYGEKQREFTEKCRVRWLNSCTWPNLRKVGSSPHPHWECQLLYALTVTVTVGGGGLTTPSTPHYISGHHFIPAPLRSGPNHR